MLPFLLVVVPLAGLVRWAAQRAGWVGTGTGVAAFVAFILVSAGALVWWLARELERQDAERREQERLLAESQVVGGVGSWAHDLRTGRQWYSDQLLRLWGRDPAGGLPPPEWFSQHVIPEDRLRIDQVIERAVAGRRGFEIEHGIHLDDGTHRVVHVRGHPFTDETGETVRMVGTTQDVTRQRADRAARDLAEQQFRQAFENSPIGMAMATLEGHYVHVNRQFAEIVGYSREALGQMSFEDLTHPDDLGRDLEAVRALLAGDRSDYAVEKRYIHADGSVVWVNFAVTLVRDAEGEPSHLLTQLQDITKRRAYESELRHLADHDPLTGLLNRRALGRDLHDHVSRVRRYGPDGALLMLDLDEFKAVNDSLGHAAGDAVIVRVARGLQGCLRESDVLARLGGDEFAVLLPQATPASTRMVARKLCDAVRREGEVEGLPPFTASVGGVLVADLGGTEVTEDDLMLGADRAMYEAKAAGGDTIVVASPGENVARPPV
jgi:diguanylate cyclase (GGDEF)-like protein/PAS domain S-box-containing protein